jgi:peptidoglycan/xylan/chitin deacetylase (PgdA/CDA1 family)
VATFGLTGAWVRTSPDLARRIVAEGHLVVNHTDRHLSFTGRSTGTAALTYAQRAQALAGAETAIRNATGATSLPWFRPPYGDRDLGVDRDVRRLGYRYELMWSVDTLGWKGVAPSVVHQRVLAAAEPGEIVLMHVGAESTDWQALDAIIDDLRSRGYTFVRADGFS